MTDELELREQLQATAVLLRREFAGVFATETIERLLHDSLDRLQQGARYRQYVPLLAERFARERLHAAAKAQGVNMSDRPSVMFLCVHNAGRSQMAAGWLRHLAGDRVEAFSGGSNPGEQIHPVAAEAMDEVGIDITDEYPSPGPTRRLGPPTSSSPWAVATPAP